jgi:uncharacterized coiled-coil protein SlyX
MSEINIAELAAQLQELKSTVSELQNALASKTEESSLLAEQVGELNAKFNELAKATGGSSIVIAEKSEPIKTSDKPYSVGKKEYLAKYPRVHYKGEVYTSEELHDKLNAGVLKALVEEFEAGKNSFFKTA